jgi:uncharacterized delta-60 repeat protein
LEFATSVALQANGKIIVGGVRSVSGGEHDFALARYNPGGSLDPSFSGNGVQATDFGGNDWANDLALQGNGKIVVVGQADSFGAQDVALARYGVGGGLDASFSGDGKQTTNFGAVDGANGVALQGNGKIVIAGFAGVTGFDFALARYNPGGALDSSFSGDGKQTTNFGLTGSDAGGQGGALGVALQADGKAVAVGLGRGATGTEDFALARYLGG